MHVPIGYFKRPSGEVIKDPDEQVREVVSMIFTLFRKYRTINGVLCALVASQIQIPVRAHGGPDKGELK